MAFERKKITLQQVKNKLLWRISKRDHSVFELRQKLRVKNDYTEEDFQLALEWLQKLGYLVDESVMAERLIKKYRSEGRSKKYISGKLRQKGIKTEPTEQEDGTIGDSLTNRDGEKEAARIFLDKKLRGKQVSELDRDEKQTMMRRMTTRGFSYETVRELLK